MTTQLIEQQNSLFVPLTDFAISEAEEMARCHQSIAKRKDVFDKSVALAGLTDWLTYDLGLTADVAMGDFYDPLLRDCHDVADLIVQETLKIECCIVEDGATDFTISPDVYPEMDSSGNALRIAYVVVRLPDDLVELEILGFLPVVELRDRDLTQPIPLSELYSPEDLTYTIRAESFDLGDFSYLEGLIKSDTDDEIMIPMICGNLEEAITTRVLLLKGEVDRDQASSSSTETIEQEQQEKMARVILRRLKSLWQ
jgi:hypothetical protein